MAIYHYSVKIIKRSEGRSSIGAAAYRAGARLTSEYDGLTHDYTQKHGIVHSEIMLPANAPASFADRQTLWNSVELTEKSKVAQLARDVELSLPVELNLAEQINLVRGYVQRTFVDRGMVADFSIHDIDTGNPHAHIMLTVRALDEHGNWLPKKRKEYILDAAGNKQYDPKTKTYKCNTITTTDWNEHSNMEVWREQWATACNRALEQKGLVERIDHRSYERQGIEREPTVHLGYVASSMEKQGKPSERGAINREIAASNVELEQLQRELASVTAQLRELPAQDVAGQMIGLMNQYTQKEIQISLNQEQRQNLERGRNQILGNISWLEEQDDTIKTNHTSVKRLQGKLDKLGMFNRKEKKELTAQLARAIESRDNAVRELQQMFGIKPSGIAAKLEQLKEKLAGYEGKIDSLPTMAGLQREQENVWEQYRQAYKTAKADPDAAAILQRVATHRLPEPKRITAKMASFDAERRLRAQFPLGPRPKQEREHRQERGGMDMGR